MKEITWLDRMDFKRETKEAEVNQGYCLKCNYRWYETINNLCYDCLGI